MSIRGKIILISVSIFFIAIGTNTLVNGIIFTREYTDARKAEAFVIAKFLKSQLDQLLALHIPVDELIGVEELCLDLIQEHDFLSYAMVVDPEGRILYHNDPARHGGVVTEAELSGNLRGAREIAQRSTFNGEDYYDIMIPVLDNHDQLVATIRIGFPEKIISQKTRRMAHYSIGVTVVTLGIGIVLLVLTLNHWVAQPLKKFIAVIQDIRRRGNRSARQVAVASNDEIGQLAQSFNQMTEELRMTTVSKDCVDNILKNMLNSLIVLSPDECIERVNQATVDLLGYSERELTGKPMALILAIPPELGQKAPDGGIIELIKNKTLQNKEIEYLARDGRKIPVVFAGSVMRDEQQQIVGVICAAQDITELKRIEEERRRLESQLRHSQKVQLLGTLAGGIAHNFNNLLVPIMGYSSLAMKLLPPAGPMNQYIREVLNSAERAKSLISQIMQFSRNIEVFDEQLSLETILSDVIKIMRATLPSNIAIEYAPAANLPPITGDCSQLHQVFMNICVNAGQAMTEGGVLSVNVEYQNLRMHTTYQGHIHSGSYVVTAIKDSGCGMDQETLDQIFNPFFTTKGPQYGNGLGLSTAFGIVATHHGFIDVESKPDHGTTFRIYLPAQAAIVKEPGFPKVDVKLDQELSILVVDDEKVVRSYLKEALEMENPRLRVMEAADGIDALDKLNGNPQGFDLMITDHMMPRMTGMQLTRKLRLDGRQLPIIMLTGYADLSLQDEDIKQSGVNAILNKPYDFRDLKLLIQRTLVAARSERNAASLKQQPNLTAANV